MVAMELASPQRPAHRRNASSKSNILRSLVSPRARNEEPQIYSPSSQESRRTQKVPIMPPDHPHGQARSKSRVLGERQGNVQSPPVSPSKSGQKGMAASKTSNDLCNTQRNSMDAPKKSKSSTNLGAVFARMNRSSKDLSVQAPKDKENTTPPSSAGGQTAYTPIWASLNTSKKQDSRHVSKDGKQSNIQEEIARYTPQEYSPSKQRNFNGGFEQSHMRPTLSKRPQSEHVESPNAPTAVGRRISGDRTSFVGRKSEDLERQKRTSVEENTAIKDFAARKASGSSTEAPAKEKLNVTKRGGRVMAAVAAFQGKSKDQPSTQKDAQPLDAKAIEHAFEEVLASRNVPETTRQKMRSMTLTVKADFIEKNQGFANGSPTDGSKSKPASKPAQPSPVDQKPDEDDGRTTKRSRPRSRTFTFSKGDKRNDDSPSKKRRSRSRSRHVAEEEAAATADSSAPPKSPRSSLDKKSGPAIPADFIAYLRKNQNPAKVEVGRMHKLRILLRNETVAWVDSFISLGGMTEIVGLLHRIMAIEWREEHEDSLLHETLNCLKGLCTTERAMAELDKVADELFPALMAMLFDDEKKGPAEYATRTIITSVLCKYFCHWMFTSSITNRYPVNYLAAATTSPPSVLSTRARKVLTYLGEPNRATDEQPIDFVKHMHAPRPYKLWSREITNVTKEVFWIFLHHLNVVPLPRPTSSSNTNTTTTTTTDPAERAKALEATYTTRHFPGSRPPVPAAPYIGGVEWDATTYLTSHLDLLNGILASLPTATDRNALRAELQASGFEKVLGGALRTCKEKFYAGVHDGLRAWVAAASEDAWDVRFVREGPTVEEAAGVAMAKASPAKKGKKKGEEVPKLDVPRLDLEIGVGGGGAADGEKGKDDDGWLG